MTSKEALITLFASYNYNGNYQELIEARETLEKDLEVLEIIKKKNVATFLIRCCNNAHDYSMKTIGFEALTDKEFKLLKEWLENE